MERDKEVLSAARKVSNAFRILKVMEKDLQVILDPEGWEIVLKLHKEGHGEHPQDVRRARVKASDAAQKDFWESMKALDIVIG